MAERMLAANRPHRQGCLCHLTLLILLLAHQAVAQEFFETKVRPVLVEKCSQCHSDKVQMAGLNLASAESRPKIISRLVDVISYEGKTKMPPSGRLTPEQIADLRSWVES